MTFMEHPTREELLSYMEGEETTPTMRAHIESCTQCTALLAGWKLTVQDLERYEGPSIEEARPLRPAAELKWAAVAAVVVLGLGFILGRLTAVNPARLKQSILAQTTQEVREQLRADVLAASRTDGQQSNDIFVTDMRDALNNLAARHNAESDKRLQALEAVIKAIQERQEASQKQFVSLLQQIQQQHQADYVSLRRDLETAVSTADMDLRQNRRQLSQLAATLVTASNERPINSN